MTIIRHHWQDIDAKYHIQEREIRNIEPAFFECGHEIAGKSSTISIADVLTEAQARRASVHSQRRTKESAKGEDEPEL